MSKKSNENSVGFLIWEHWHGERKRERERDKYQILVGFWLLVLWDPEMAEEIPTQCSPLDDVDTTNICCNLIAQIIKAMYYWCMILSPLSYNLIKQFSMTDLRKINNYFNYHENHHICQPLWRSLRSIWMVCGINISTTMIWNSNSEQRTQIKYHEIIKAIEKEQNHCRVAIYYSIRTDLIRD